MMQNKRRHKRFKVDQEELDGSMLLTDNVEVLNMSFGGVTLKADKVLDIGKRYSITLAEKEQGIAVKGVVVRSLLRETEERSDGKRVTICTASLKFEDGQIDKIVDILDAIEKSSAPETPVAADRRLSVRFHITMPLNTILSHSAQFKVKKISQSGLLIRSDQALEVNSSVPMGLSLSKDDRINFRGRVASCQRTFEEGHAYYDIGVGFADLTEQDRALLATFITSLEAREGAAEVKQ